MAARLVGSAQYARRGCDRDVAGQLCQPKERCPETFAAYSKPPRQSYIVQIKVSEFILDCPVETTMPSEEVDPNQAGKLDPRQGQRIQELVRLDTCALEGVRLLDCAGERDLARCARDRHKVPTLRD